MIAFSAKIDMDGQFEGFSESEYNGPFTRLLVFVFLNLKSSVTSFVRARNSMYSLSAIERYDCLTHVDKLNMRLTTLVLRKCHIQTVNPAISPGVTKQCSDRSGQRCRLGMCLPSICDLGLGFFWLGPVCYLNNPEDVALAIAPGSRPSPANTVFRSAVLSHPSFRNDYAPLACRFTKP